MPSRESDAIADLDRWFREFQASPRRVHPDRLFEQTIREATERTIQSETLRRLAQDNLNALRAATERALADNTSVTIPPVDPAPQLRRIYAAHLRVGDRITLLNAEDSSYRTLEIREVTPVDDGLSSDYAVRVLLPSGVDVCDYILNGTAFVRDSCTRVFVRPTLVPNVDISRRAA